jgi:hypothetical protein
MEINFSNIPEIQEEFLDILMLLKISLIFLCLGNVWKLRNAFWRWGRVGSEICDRAVY